MLEKAVESFIQRERRRGSEGGRCEVGSRVWEREKAGDEVQLGWNAEPPGGEAGYVMGQGGGHVVDGLVDRVGEFKEVEVADFESNALGGVVRWVMV